MPSRDRIQFFPPIEIVVPDLEMHGRILDIGGGGEGIVGLLKGAQVVAIDISERELAEAPPGPLKIVMDAKQLQFLDASFEMVTAFFSLMYVRDHADLERIMAEARRVLQPGGQVLIWDTVIPGALEGNKDIFVVKLKVRVGETEIETGYGQLWPGRARDLAYYQALAQQAGFEIVEAQSQETTFFMRLCSPAPRDAAGVA